MDLKLIADQALARLKIETTNETAVEQAQIARSVKSSPICAAGSCRTFPLREHSTLVPSETKCETGLETRNISWNKEDTRVIDGYVSKAWRFPAKPFWLKQAVWVADLEKFHRNLLGDIERGPNGHRAIFGALQDDLRCLEKIANTEPTKNEQEKIE